MKMPALHSLLWRGRAWIVVAASAAYAWTAPSIAAQSTASDGVPTLSTSPDAGQPLTMDEAIARALKHNQQIKVSDFGRGIGRANVLAEYGRFDPAFTFQRTYSESESAFTDVYGTQLIKTDNYSLGLTGVTPWGLNYQIGGTAQNQRGTYNAFSNNFVTFGGVSVTQPLLRGFGFGANLANLHLAKADRAIADWQFRQTVLDTITNVTIAYINVAEARENVVIARRARDLAAQTVSDNEKRNKIGFSADADVTQARARAASREEGILLAQRQLKSAENQLRELMGDRDVAADAPDFAIGTLVPVSFPIPEGATVLNRALDLRPDYQAAKQGIVKQKANRTLAGNQLLPRVDFVGSFGYNGINPNFAASRAQVRNEDNRAYSIGMQVSVPLTFAQGRGRYRAAKLAVQQSQADLDRLEQDIAVSIANAIGQLETTAQRVQTTNRAYDLAQQALDAEEKRFKAGTSSTFYVLQYQEQLTSSQASQVRAIADERRAIALFEREAGTTLISHNLRLE